jgi:hypothetical protein
MKILRIGKSTLEIEGGGLKLGDTLSNASSSRSHEAANVTVQPLIPRALGAQLLVAAFLNAHELVVRPVTTLGWLSALQSQVAAFETELLLGLWLISAPAIRRSWEVWASPIRP